jgi:hypothetical protein
MPAEEVPPILVVNPISDQRFVEFAHASLKAGGETPQALQERLRVEYPAAVVRPRELADERQNIWYIYRDGRWVRS